MTTTAQPSTPDTSLTPPPATAGRVHLPLLATLTSPLHHGAGSSGNTSLLRREDIVLPDGTPARVPFVSGNSLRHTLRAALAWHLARTWDLPEASLAKPVVDLLWSGGSISRTGAEARLELHRKAEALLPFLTLLGYSAAADMIAGNLWANHMHLVCQENAWRLPATVAALPQTRARAGSFQTETFGTRHDVRGTAVDHLVHDDPATSEQESKDTKPTSTQMLYDVQVLKPGSLLAGSFDVTPAATPAQRAVLLVALDEAAPEYEGERHLQLAAKGGTGYGQTRLQTDLSLLGDVTQARVWWEQHLRAHRDEALAYLKELVA